MLFLITQDHAPEDCPLEAGGTEALHADPKSVAGLRVVAAYGAFAEHVLYYLVEADDQESITRFLLPAFRRAHASVSPVTQFMG